MREREREKSAHMHAGDRVREKALWLLLLYVFSSTWACPMQIGLSQECCLFCLFCLKSSLWSSDLPCLLATTILDSFSLFYLPSRIIMDFHLYPRNFNNILIVDTQRAQPNLVCSRSQRPHRD